MKTAVFTQLLNKMSKTRYRLSNTVMTIKNKLRAGFGFLFLLAFVCCGLAIYYLNRLSADSSVILKDNYETLVYMRNIGVALDNNTGALDKTQTDAIETNLVKQEHNVTESGEQQLTDSLRSKYEQLKLLPGGDAEQSRLRPDMRKLAYGIMQLNMKALERKNTSRQRHREQRDHFGGIDRLVPVPGGVQLYCQFPGIYRQSDQRTYRAY